MCNFEVPYKDGKTHPANCFSQYVDDWGHRKRIEKELEEVYHLKDCLFLSITEIRNDCDEVHGSVKEIDQLYALGGRRNLQIVEIGESEQPEMPENADEIIKNQLTYPFCSNIKEYILDPSRP